MVIVIHLRKSQKKNISQKEDDKKNSLKNYNTKKNDSMKSQNTSQFI